MGHSGLNRWDLQELLGLFLWGTITFYSMFLGYYRFLNFELQNSLLRTFNGVLLISLGILGFFCGLLLGFFHKPKWGLVAGIIGCVELAGFFIPIEGSVTLTGHPNCIYVPILTIIFASLGLFIGNKPELED